MGREERRDPKTSNLLRLLWAGNSYRLRVPAGGHWPPRGRPRRTKVRKGASIPQRVGEASSAQPAGAHVRAHAPPQPPADTCRRPRTLIARSAAPSLFPARTTRSGARWRGERGWGRRGSPEGTCGIADCVSQRQQSTKQLHGA